MSRRIDIEITSINGATATWRAAGARQPKGTLDTSLLTEGFVVGNVYRAEVEQYMEGVDVLSVTPPKTASPLDPRNERLSLIAPEPKGPDVQVIYASKGRGARRDDDRRGGDRPRSDRPRGDRPDRGGERSERSSSDRKPREGGSERSSRGPRPSSDRRGARPSGPAQAPVATVHRNALLATLSPEQLPVAEQLLRGGMPAVRTAVAEQNKNATQQGRPTINAEAIDRIAEELLPKTNLAFWKDRAAGALGAGKELRLRDLRAVVTSAKTVNVDDEARAQLKELQAQLTTRVDALRTEWTNKLDKALANNDVLESLRLASRTPDPSTRVSSENATKIAQMVSEALSVDAAPAVWIEIVNTAVESPIRRLVKPAGIPADEACNALAVKSAGSIPEFAKMLGMKVPPPPPPVRPTRRPSPSRHS